MFLTERGLFRFRVQSARISFVVLALLCSANARAHSQSVPEDSTTGQSSKVDNRVASLIEKMVHKRTEHKAFAELEALGCSALASVIRRMDDRRKLPDPSISLENKSPQALEGLRHYGPERVVDALAAILNQLTGQDFGSIYNGATDAERTKAVQGWRDWLRRTPPEKLCSGG